ncbi:hypothetical protein [Streptomyces sp. NPDC001635]
MSRTNGWQISEYVGEASPWGQQHLLDRAVWDPDELGLHLPLRGRGPA